MKFYNSLIAIVTLTVVAASNSKDIVPKEYFKLDESVEDKFMAVADLDLLFKVNK